VAVDSDVVCEVADVTVEQGVGAAEVGEERGTADEEGECDVVVSEDNIADGVVVDDVGRCCAMDSDGIVMSAFDGVDVGAFVVTFEGVVVESSSRLMISVLGSRADLTLIFFLRPLEDAATSSLLCLDGLAPVRYYSKSLMNT
jgi:hypothetical protein